MQTVRVVLSYLHTRHQVRREDWVIISLEGSTLGATVRRDRHPPPFIKQRGNGGDSNSNCGGSAVKAESVHAKHRVRVMTYMIDMG